LHAKIKNQDATPDTQRTKSDPMIIEQSGMRMTIAHRQGLGGSDEGLTFNITTAGSEDDGKRILRFDCFYKNTHYHIGASGEHSVHNMKDEGVEARSAGLWTSSRFGFPQ
jgi:hypothetical protein